jgi:hypothetical protein
MEGFERTLRQMTTLSKNGNGRAAEVASRS